MFLNEGIKNIVTKYLNDKISRQNFHTFLTISNLFRTPTELEVLMFIDCCFAIISETDEFLQLDAKLVGKILQSSSLALTSEIEVFNAASAWLGYNFDERKRFAEDLLLKVRLPLLSDEALNFALKENSSFRRNEGCPALVDEILKSKQLFYKDKSSKYLQNRYCSHDMYDILVFGGEDDKTFQISSNIIQVNSFDNFNGSELISSLVEKRRGSTAVHSKGNVFVFAGTNGTLSNEEYSHYRYEKLARVEKYSSVSKTSEVVADMSELDEGNFDDFCVCAFGDKIYLIGGYSEHEAITNSCFEFDTKDYSWKDKSRMNEIRESPAAVGFQGKIIVSGGMQWDDDDDEEDDADVNYYDDGHLKVAKTVEAYDPLSDKWSDFPSMIHSRCHHASVAIKNKFFVIGGGTAHSEVYDSACGKFVDLKPSFAHFDDLLIQDRLMAFTVGKNIFVFFSKSSKVLCYDSEENEWFEKSREATKDLSEFCCVKIPRL